MDKVTNFKKSGKKKDEEVDEDHDDENDEEDSDYELEGGDLAIYDSKLDDVDELVFVRDTLERMNQGDATYVARLLAGLNPEELQAFNEAMQSSQSLKEREDLINK